MNSSTCYKRAAYSAAQSQLAMQHARTARGKDVKRVSIHVDNARSWRKRARWYRAEARQRAAWERRGRALGDLAARR